MSFSTELKEEITEIEKELIKIGKKEKIVSKEVVEQINTELKAKVEELTKSLEQYRNIEQTLQSTLLMAQTTAEDVKKVAKQQADQIINDAKDTAKQQAIELDNEIIAKRKELDDVKKQFDIYKAKMESLLISQLELLKDVNKDDE